MPKSSFRCKMFQVYLTCSFFESLLCNVSYREVRFTSNSPSYYVSFQQVRFPVISYIGLLDISGFIICCEQCK